jgi:hypothetical protein
MVSVVGWVLMILMGVMIAAQAVEFVCAMRELGKRAAVVCVVVFAVAIWVVSMFGPKRGAADDVFGPAGGMTAAEQRGLVAWE